MRPSAERTSDLSPTINDMFPGRFLRGSDLKSPATVVIRRVVQERMYSRAERAEADKWVVYFEGARKGLVLNRTNAEKIAEIVGSRDSDDWIGRQVVLYPVEIEVAGARRPAVRVRAPGEAT